MIIENEHNGLAQCDFGSVCFPGKQGIKKEKKIITGLTLSFGLPFVAGDANETKPCWVVLGTRFNQWASSGFVCHGGGMCGHTVPPIGGESASHSCYKNMKVLSQSLHLSPPSSGSATGKLYSNNLQTRKQERKHKDAYPSSPSRW